MKPSPIELVLSRLPTATRNGDGWIALCPAHDDKNPSLSITQGADRRVLLHCHAGCSPEAVCESIGLKLADLFPGKPERNGGPRKVVATYDYTDEGGVLLHQKLRYVPKDFSMRRPDGKGGWIRNLKGVRRVLYRLP